MVLMSKVGNDRDSKNIITMGTNKDQIEARTVARPGHDTVAGVTWYCAGAGSGTKPFTLRWTQVLVKLQL